MPLPDNYRPATSEDVPEGRACGNCALFDESDVAPDGRARCTLWDEYVDGGFYCNSWVPAERGYPDDEDEDDRSIGMEVTPVTPRSKGADVEFRSFTGELRQEGDSNTFVGYAAVFNSPSEPLPFIERIAPGAFSKTLRARKQDIKLYVNHNSDMVLASRNSGTLRLSEDERGLRVEADLPEDVSYSRDLMSLMRSGVVDKMSFGFQVDRKGDKWSDDGMERTLTSVRLFEVSVVTGFPAYEATTAAVRSLSALSVRTGISVDDLSDTLEALAAGDDVEPAKVEALAQIVNGALPQPEPEPVSLLGLKQKNMDLLAKKW
jgi:HK97 family phage prohead protease